MLNFFRLIDFVKIHKFFFVACFVNTLLIFWIYQSVFSLELQGDTWQYAWGHQIYYGSNVFSAESLKGMRTSLGGASLTFGLLQNNFGLNPLVYYSTALVLKLFTVIAFYLLVKKITRNFFASLIGSLILSVSFAGVEAIHWVFNMYAYIGLLCIILSLFIGLDLADKFTYKRWLISFLLACVGVWYATMRTNGIIPLILIIFFVKMIAMRSSDSVKNFTAWIIGFGVFILIDKFLLGQMETDYSRHYIIGQGIASFQSQIADSKYDFIFSSATNLGAIILPDVTWSSLNFPKLFSFLGGSRLRSVIAPSFIIFSLLAVGINNILSEKKITNVVKNANLLFILQLGFLWTLIIYLVTKVGPQNFPSWENIVLTLFGGYLLVFCIYFVVVRSTPIKLKNLFFITLLWGVVYLLVPLFQNGGPNFGTYHRYMVTTAPAVSLFIAGLVTLSLSSKNLIFKSLIMLVALFIIVSHGLETKSFFDRKAQVHNRQLTAKIWDQFSSIVPNKDEYAKENPPTLWFESADNPKDRETLFETLYFGFLFQASIKYGWNPHAGTGLYYENYKDLVAFIKKNPRKLNDLYGMRMENQSLINVTENIRDRISEEILP